MNREQLSDIVLKHRDCLFRIALGYVKNIQDAEDITQNVFVKLIQYTEAGRGNFPTDEAQKAWLIRVTINEAKNLLKSSWQTKRAELDESLAAPENGDLGLYEYVKNLPPKYRTVIYLYYYEGYSVKEIAEILHMSGSTVTTQLARAREQLKTVIEEEGKNYGKAIYTLV